MPHLFLSLFASASQSPSDIPLWLVIPFALLLLLIAVFPLTPAGGKAWWEHHYHWVSLGLAALVAAYYFALVPQGGLLVAHTGSVPLIVKRKLGGWWFRRQKGGGKFENPRTTTREEKHTDWSRGASRGYRTD